VPTIARRTKGPAAAVLRVKPYEQVKQAIMTGELAPGAPLVEQALAEWCKVSRTPVREALTRLEQDGLVVRTDRGLVVRESSPEEILDIYDTRIVLESRAAFVAAERRSSFDIVGMRKAAERSRRADSAGALTLAETNRQFHRSVWQASHNASLIDLLERLNMLLGRYPATTLSFPGRHTQSNEEHGKLIDAIEARDSEAAAEIATVHFTAARDIRLKLWETE
jgi:DNA-binding GntR family transcriptional regulator